MDFESRLKKKHEISSEDLKPTTRERRMKISLVILWSRRWRKTSTEAVRETLELGAISRRTGIPSFWVSEHHNVPALSISAPEVMIPYLASHTKNIHIGSGGIMGLHYSPYKVAEIMSTLEGLFQGVWILGLAIPQEHLLWSSLCSRFYSKEQYARG